MNDDIRSSQDKIPEIVKNAVLMQSSPIPIGTPVVKGCITSLQNKKFKNLE